MGIKDTFMRKIPRIKNLGAFAHPPKASKTTIGKIGAVKRASRRKLKLK
jgi:hypothetical protein